MVQPHIGNPQLISQQELKTRVVYDVEKGEFYWLKTRIKRYIGQRASYFHPNGYVYLRIGKRTYFVHRLAWLYVYGQFPTGELDHIDGDKTNNRVNNLRIVTREENMQNQVSAHSNNSTGFLGVKRTRSGKFTATVKINKRIKHLPTFATAREAHAAYVSAKAAMQVRVRQ